MHYLNLDHESLRLSRALQTRNRSIAVDLVNHFRSELSPTELANFILANLEKLLSHEADTVLWAMRQVIPADILEEMRRSSLGKVSTGLIAQGMIPGKDFSLDAGCNLLLNSEAKKAILNIR